MSKYIDASILEKDGWYMQRIHQSSETGVYVSETKKPTDFPAADIPRWIPATERLPDDVQIGEDYPNVIFCTKEKTYTGFYECYLGGRWWSDCDEIVYGVIAWMPLPDPYKEGEEE